MVTLSTDRTLLYPSMTSLSLRWNYRIRSLTALHIVGKGKEDAIAVIQNQLDPGQKPVQMCSTLVQRSFDHCH